MTKKKEKRTYLTYNLEAAIEICEYIAEGYSVRRIGRETEYSAATIFYWLNKHEAFRKLYDDALVQRGYAMFEEIIDIADDSEDDYVSISLGTDDDGEDQKAPIAFDREHVQRSKLKIEARQWSLERMNPKKYGNKIQQDVNITDMAGLLESRNSAAEKLRAEQLEQFKKTDTE